MVVGNKRVILFNYSDCVKKLKIYVQLCMYVGNVSVKIELINPRPVARNVSSSLKF